MGVVRVIVGIPLLLLLVGIPGWLILRLLLCLTPQLPFPRREGGERGRFCIAPPPVWGGGQGVGRSPPAPSPISSRSNASISPSRSASSSSGRWRWCWRCVGVYSLWLLALIVALGSVGLGIIARRKALPVIAWRWERATWRCLALLAVAAALFLRPGETLIGGEDTGVYYNSGVAMAKQGGIFLHDPVLADIDGDKATVRHLLGNLDNAALPLLWRYSLHRLLYDRYERRDRAAVPPSLARVAGDLLRLLRHARARICARRLRAIRAARPRAARAATLRLARRADRRRSSSR